MCLVAEVLQVCKDFRHQNRGLKVQDLIRIPPVPKCILPGIFLRFRLEHDSILILVDSHSLVFLLVIFLCSFDYLRSVFSIGMENKTK